MIANNGYLLLGFAIAIKRRKYVFYYVSRHFYAMKRRYIAKKMQFILPDLITCYIEEIFACFATCRRMPTLPRFERTAFYSMPKSVLTFSKILKETYRPTWIFTWRHVFANILLHFMNVRSRVLQLFTMYFQHCAWMNAK